MVPVRVPAAVGGVLVVAGVALAGGAPVPGPPPDPAAVEVTFVDDSSLKVKVLDDKLEVVTRYGTLAVPVREVRRIEFGVRLSDAEAKGVEAAVADLVGPDPAKREAAVDALAKYGAKAVPAATRAAAKAPPDAAAHARAAVDRLLADPAARPDLRDHDVVVTDDSQIAGRVAAPAVRVATLPFGEQPLRLADVKALRSLTGDPGPGVAAADGPPTLMAFQGQVGRTLAFRVTGGAAGSVWGTGTYTLDSALAAAAVHAGVLRPGQAGVVQVRIVASPPGFAGSVRNGVSSAPYGPFAGGAFQFVGGR